MRSTSHISLGSSHECNYSEARFVEGRLWIDYGPELDINSSEHQTLRNISYFSALIIWANVCLTIMQLAYSQFSERTRWPSRLCRIPSNWASAYLVEYPANWLSNTTDSRGPVSWACNQWSILHWWTSSWRMPFEERSISSGRRNKQIVPTYIAEVAGFNPTSWFPGRKVGCHI